MKQIAAARSEVSAGYVASIRKLMVFNAEAEPLEYARERAIDDIGLARMKLEGFFKENIIHKGIKVIDKPDDSEWLAIQLAGGWIRIYARGEDEVALLRNFMERSKKEIDALVRDCNSKREIFAKASEAFLENLILADIEGRVLVNSAITARMSGLREKFEYIIYLRKILEHEKQNMPGEAGILSGNGS